MKKTWQPIASGPGARRTITLTTASQITPTGGVLRRIMSRKIYDIDIT